MKKKKTLDTIYGKLETYSRYFRYFMIVKTENTTVARKYLQYARNHQIPVDPCSNVNIAKLIILTY